MEDSCDSKEAKSITLLLTNSCNLNCVYCYEKYKNNRRMDFATARDAIMNEMADGRFHVYNIEFMGGEPLLEFPLIKEVSEWLWSQDIKQNYTLFVVSNGTLLNDEMRAWFSDNKQRISIGLSFDGNIKAQNTNRCNSANRIDLDFFRETWPYEGIKMTISPFSLETLADDIIFLEEKGFKRILSNLAYMEGWKNEHLLIWNRELEKLCNYYLDSNKAVHCSLFTTRPDSIFVDHPKHKRCGCGHFIVCIDSDGKKYPCHMFSPMSMPQEKYAEVKHLDFDDDDNFFNPQCESCLLREACPQCCGNNLIHLGALDAIGPFYCKAFAIQYMHNLKYNISKAEYIEDENERNATINDLITIANQLKIKV